MQGNKIKKKIDIKDEGDVFISSNDSAMIERAKDIILMIAEDLQKG